MLESIRILDTPLGRYRLAASAAGLCRVEPAGAAEPQAADAGADPHAADAGAAPDAVAHVEAAARALSDYFAGRRRGFEDVALAPAGTAFQREVWAALRAIPYGSTASYGDVARRIGRPAAARAVGSANHRNPLAIITPCHRVVGGNGSLVGYAGGLDRKAWLLIHEAACLARMGADLTPAAPGLPRSRAAATAPRTRAGEPARATATAAGRSLRA
jgi:methylated-DNA-[protein]-cysteine S-methyltransferase